MGAWRQNYQTQGAGLHPAEQSAHKATVTTHPDALFINGILPTHPPKKCRPALHTRAGAAPQKYRGIRKFPAGSPQPLNVTSPHVRRLPPP